MAKKLNYKSNTKSWVMNGWYDIFFIFLNLFNKQENDMIVKHPYDIFSGKIFNFEKIIQFWIKKKLYICI